MSQRLKAFFHRINDALENVTTLERIALGANAALDLAKQRANLTTEGGYAISVTGHLARCG